MVDLMLDDLGLEAVQDAHVGLHLHVLPLEADGAVALCLAGALQGEAAFLGLILP